MHTNMTSEHIHSVLWLNEYDAFLTLLSGPSSETVNAFPGSGDDFVMTYDEDFEAHFGDSLDCLEWHQIKYEQAVRKIMLILDRNQSLFEFYRSQTVLEREKNATKILSLVKAIQESSGIEKKRYEVTGAKYYKVMLALKLAKKLRRMCFQAKIEMK
jgi:hypothetical protein